MLELRVGYPSRAEEERIVEQTTGAAKVAVRSVLDAETLLAMQGLVRRIPVSQGLIRAAVSLVRMTRPGEADAPAAVKQYVEWGAGPRASQYLVLGAKARAALDGRPMADLDDVKAVAPSVLRHRVVTNFAAEAAGRTSEDLVLELLRTGSWSA
jgi:MoxR-like ATPase